MSASQEESPRDLSVLLEQQATLQRRLDDLAESLCALEQENARLRASDAVPDDETGTPPSTGTRRRFLLRGLGAAAAAAGAATALPALPALASGAPGSNGLRLPYAGHTNSTKTAFAVTNQGSGQGDGVSGTGNTGVHGSTNVYGGTGVLGQGMAQPGEHSTGGFGVWGISDNIGVLGQVSDQSAQETVGVSGYGATGVSGYGTTGVYGESTATDGTGIGVAGSGSYGNTAVAGQSDTGIALSGFSSYGGVGVRGTSTSYVGVQGVGGYIGVIGEGSAAGVYGETDGTAGAWAGYFSGDVQVTGNLSKAGGTFKIDHPLDPANKYLLHSFVESPERMNIYGGTVLLDAHGEATVGLPTWFETLNRDFRYQLTAIGASAPNLYIAAEIVNGHFTLAGGVPGMKVSWQVTGVRQDPWAMAHPLQVEQDKPAHERGQYLHPQLYGQPEEQAIGRIRLPEIPQQPIRFPPRRKVVQR